MSTAKKTSKTNNKKSLGILYFLGLLLAISTALPAYIQSNFLGQFVSVSMVGAFFILANSLSVLAIIFFPEVIKYLGNYFVTKVVLVLYASALLGLSLANSPLAALISIILFAISYNLIWINMDILVESFSSYSSTGRTRTTYFTCLNAGWILSPALATFLIGKGNYSLTFLIASALTIPFFFIFLYHGRKLKDRVKYQKEKISLTWRKMWKNKNLRGIFFISILIQLFYSSAVLYIPIYLVHNLGMSWSTLGPIFSVMLLPFIILEIPAGILADKYLGEKEILFTGFLILIISLFLFYYIPTPNAWLWLAVLFSSRVGAALIEAMKETYFFKIVDVENVGYINLFRTATPLAYILGSSLAIVTLVFFPLNYLFLFLSIIMLIGFGFVASIKDTK
jgi:MFS family permease